MPLEIRNDWRFRSPSEKLPTEFVTSIAELIGKIAAPASLQETIEHFKSYFSLSLGRISVRSSSRSWAQADLDSTLHEAANNPPLFIKAFFDACESLEEKGFAIPDIGLVNRLLSDFDIRYRIEPPNLVQALPLDATNAIAVVEDTVNAAYVSKQMSRLKDALAADPELAIGTAKEFLETICRTILRERNIAFPVQDDMPGLVKATIDSVPTLPRADHLDPHHAKTIRVFVNNLASIGRSIAELRNAFGTGHGKDANHKGLTLRHAKLAVDTALIVGVFLFESHQSDD